MLALIKTKHSRGLIYKRMKGNITNHELKSFHTEYEHLHNEYWDLDIKAFQETIKPLARSLFPLDSIKDCIVRRQKDFSLINTMVDSRLMALLKKKQD